MPTYARKETPKRARRATNISCTTTESKLLSSTSNLFAIVEQIKQQQNNDLELMKIRKGVEEGKNKEFTIQNEVLWHGNRLYVPNITTLKKEFLKEAHNSTLVLTPEVQRCIIT